MTGFLLAAVVLLATGAGALLWPLLRNPRGSPQRRAGAIVALFRDQLRELEAERKSGAIEEAQYLQSRREIEHNLLEEVAQADSRSEGPRRARWSAALVGAFMVLVPMVLYATLGTPDALIPGMVESGANVHPNANGGARALTNAQVQKMIEALQANLKKSPGDVKAWVMLARAYAYERQYPDSVRALTRAVALQPQNPHLLADLADALAMANGQRLDGEPLKLIERALQLDPHEVKALALAGTAAFDHQQYAKAAEYWERALQVAPNEGEFSQNLRNSLEEARQLAGSSPTAPTAPAIASDDKSPAPQSPAASPIGGSVRGKVMLAASLAAKAQPGDTVFVFARAAQGPRVPLAMVRRQVKDLPFEFALDDSMAMTPDFTVSKYSPVIVGARISRSGDAIASPGDLQGFSKPVKVGAGSVSITIDQVVP